MVWLEGVGAGKSLARHASDQASHALVFRCFLPFLLSSQCLATELFGTKRSSEFLREAVNERGGRKFDSNT